MPFGLYALHSYLKNCIRWNYTIMIIIIIQGVFYGPSGLSIVSFTMIIRGGCNLGCILGHILGHILGRILGCIFWLYSIAIISRIAFWPSF